MTRTAMTRVGLLAPAAALVIGLGLALAGPGAQARAPQDSSKAKINHYVGAAKCKTCHQSEESGDQYAAWEQMPHANAYATLATARAKEVAAELGIPDPQKADECLRCHVTGHTLPPEHLKRGFKIEQGVQCESCHGPGEAHMKARMIAAAKGGASDGYVPVPAGEIVASPTAESCRECHSPEGPTYKRFCFHERVVGFRHWNPKKPRTQEELDAVLVCGCEECACDHECSEGCAVTTKAKRDGK